MTRADQNRGQAKTIRKLQARIEWEEEQLASYEKLVDRTQLLLNKRIEELETAPPKVIYSLLPAWR